MLPPMLRDPDGYYARLGLAPSASPAAIAAAYRRQARRLHPDVPGTGSVEAFVALKAAYDVLRDPVRRQAYDRTAAATPAVGPAATAVRSAAPQNAAPPVPGFDRRFLLWIGFLVGSTVLAAWLMVAIATGPTSGLSGRAAPPAAAPVRIARLPLLRPGGAADHFVLPGLSAATVWQDDPRRGGLRPVGRLPDFTAVHVLGVAPDRRLTAIRLAGGAIGFVASLRLAAGDRSAAHQAFCADRAGLPPRNGAVLTRRGSGAQWVAIANHDLEPAVVKLRNLAGQVIASIYLSPGGQGVLRDLQAGPWIVEYAAGELWSQPCARFAAGERALRFRFPLGSGSILTLPPDLPPSAMPVDIPDRVFAQP